MRKGAVLLAAGVLLAAPGAGQDAPDPTELVDTLLSGLLGFRETTGPELQREVAEVGGIAFRSEVPLDFMTRAELSGYLREVLDSEYPPEKARVDQRTLAAFDLFPPDGDLRALRARVLAENVVGFYDERPGRKRLYVVSGNRRLGPANQLILSHELRHALQDQYVDLHRQLPESIGDFDDRRLAWLALFEGDATLVMERFLVRRLPGGGPGGEWPGLSSLPAGLDLPEAPPVVRDQLVQPYLAGLAFARALWARGGPDELPRAWARPPDSTEQVLHPEKYFAREAPVAVDVDWSPGGGRLVNEGVLGELLARTLLDGAEAPAAGWGGDRFRLWEVDGRTLLVWRSVWDAEAEAREFEEAVLSRFTAAHGPPERRDGHAVWRAGAWSFAIGARAGGVELLSADDPGLLEEARRARPGEPGGAPPAR